MSRLPPLEPVLLGVVVPALVSGAVLLAAWWPRARDGAVAGGRWGGAVGFGGGYALAHALTFGWPAFPPTDVANWLPFLALAAALLDLADPWLGRGVWWRRLARASLCLGAMWLLARPVGTPLATIALFAAAMLAGWLSLEELSRRTRGATVPLSVAVAGIGGSAALLMGGVASLAQLAGSVVAMSGAAGVVALLNRRLTLAAGGASVIAAVTAYMWFDGALYATEPLPLTAALLLVAAPSGAWIGEAAFLRRLGWAPRLALRGGAVALLAGAAVALGLT